MAGSKKSYKDKKQYPFYKAAGRFALNKIAKIKKHIKAHPEDENAIRALAACSKSDVPTRKKPGTRMYRFKSDMNHETIRGKLRGHLRALSYVKDGKIDGMLRGFDPFKASDLRRNSSAKTA